MGNSFGSLDDEAGLVSIMLSIVGNRGVNELRTMGFGGGQLREMVPSDGMLLVDGRL